VIFSFLVFFSDCSRAIYSAFKPN